MNIIEIRRLKRDVEEARADVSKYLSDKDTHTTHSPNNLLGDVLLYMAYAETTKIRLQAQVEVLKEILKR